MMQITEKVKDAIELIQNAASNSKMIRIVYIENARIVVGEFDKKDWDIFVILAKDLNAVEFNMLVSIGIKKPYRATLFKNRLEKWK